METATQTNPQPVEKRFQCRHVLTAGQRCGAAALRRENFCYYHHATRRPLPRLKFPAYPDAEFERFIMPVLEDRAAIQLAISQVLTRIAANELDPKRARLLLFGLQIAIRALPRQPASGRDASGRFTPKEEVNHLRDLNQIELDPELGLLAPIAEHTPPEERKSYAQRLLEELRKKPEPEEEPAPPQPESIPTIQAVATNPSCLRARLQRVRKKG